MARMFLRYCLKKLVEAECMECLPVIVGHLRRLKEHSPALLPALAAPVFLMVDSTGHGADPASGASLDLSALPLTTRNEFRAHPERGRCGTFAFARGARATTLQLRARLGVPPRVQNRRERGGSTATSAPHPARVGLPCR